MQDGGCDDQQTKDLVCQISNVSAAATNRRLSICNAGYKTGEMLPVYRRPSTHPILGQFSAKEMSENQPSLLDDESLSSILDSDVVNFSSVNERSRWVWSWRSL